MKNNLRTLKALTSIMNPSMVKADIFKGVKMPYKRAKETKKRAPYKHDEQDLSKRISDDLDILELQGRIVHHDRYNCGKVQTIFGYWIKLCREGTADRNFMMPGRLIIYIETKAKTGQSKKQKEFQEKVERAGHKYYIVSNWVKWGEVRAKHIMENILK